MTIDEAIEREKQLAEIHRNYIVPKEDYHNMPWISENNEVNIKISEYHEQLAKWLEELKDYQDKNKMVVRVDCDFENIDSIKDKIDELSKYAESQYNKAIDDVLKLPKYTHYDTSNEFMNIRIDSISIEDILKLKEQNNDKWKQSKPNRND